MFFNLGTPPKGPPPPYKAWPARHLRVLERAISVAWEQTIATPHGATLATSGKEAEITALLQDALTDLLASGQVHGFSSAVFGVPIRGQELEDYTGRYLEKRPDLTFPRLSARPAINHHAMFYECKILGRGRTLDDYLLKGVARFLSGNYAWAMPHAGMIAYVAEGPHDAYAVLSENWAQSEEPCASAPCRTLEQVRDSASVIAVSTHARSFRLRNGQEPGNIALRHLWLAVKPQSR